MARDETDESEDDWMARRVDDWMTRVSNAWMTRGSNDWMTRTTPQIGGEAGGAERAASERFRRRRRQGTPLRRGLSTERRSMISKIDFEQVIANWFQNTPFQIQLTGIEESRAHFLRDGRGRENERKTVPSSTRREKAEGYIYFF